MFHRKMAENGKTYRFGIRWKMTFLLLTTFLVGGVILYAGIHTQLQRIQEEQIAQELQGIRENTEIYVRQLLILNDANNDEASYKRIAPDIVRELYSSSGRYVSVLDKEGVYLNGNQAVFADAPQDDLLQAIQGDAAFTLTYPKQDEMQVYFSMPVIIENRVVGIIRYQVDKSELFVQGRETERLVCQTAAIVFAVVLLLLLFLVGRILIPVKNLTEVSRQVTQDLSHDRVDTQVLAELADSKQKDEVGELSRNVSVMLETIGNQFKKMQKDQDRILELLDNRQTFYNNVTHELKTPLTTIQGYAQLMEADDGQDKELTKNGLHHILEESSRLHKMVVQLLEMSDKSAFLDKKLVDLSAVACSVAQAMEIRAARYGMNIETAFAEELWVMGLEDRLRQVIINLVDNAMKYGDDHTTIHIYGMHHENQVMLSVQNQGRGLSEEEKSRIFEPFYRVDKTWSREHGSTGLGLSICEKILKEHGGSIGVESGVQNQTIFSIQLNAAKQNGKEVRL